MSGPAKVLVARLGAANTGPHNRLESAATCPIVFLRFVPWCARSGPAAVALSEGT
ncbi:MAG: hypothetical protein ACR2QM_20405 [Longimicrobiales bacterium]